jgi:tRNA(Arg) A34 adenosine deaminase TadA
MSAVMPMTGRFMPRTLGAPACCGNPAGVPLDGPAPEPQVPAMLEKASPFMTRALELAEAAERRGEVPVGCVLVDGETGKVLGEAANRTEELGDPTAHAELIAIREACAKAGAPRLVAADLYVTLEPCAMCAAAISMARIRRLYYGAYDPKMGAVDHGVRFFESASCHHKPEVIGGVGEQRAGALLKNFFRDRR